MAVMNQIAIEPKVVDELESTYQDIGFTPPNIDIENSLNIYINSLENVEKHERQHRIEAWIKAQLNPNLTVWESKYSQNSDLLYRASAEIQKLEQAKKRDQVNMDNLQSDLGDLKNEKKLKEREIKEHRKDDEGKKNIDIKYEKMKATILLIFSFLIAIGTYTYFANTQIDIGWSTMDNNTKVGIVKNLITQEGSTTQYGVFSNLIEDENENPIPIENVKDKDLYPINSENIDLAPTPNLFEYASTSNGGIVLILAFSSFLLILMGKITATVYEKLGMPNWMYFIIYILAILVLIGAVISNSSLSGYKTEKSLMKNEIITINSKLTNIKEDDDTGGFSDDFESEKSKEENPKLLELEKEKKELKSKIGNLNDSIADFKFITMLLFMFAEILVGSLAWIAYAEYIDKKIKLSSSGQGLYNILQDELKEMGEKIEKFMKDIDAYQDRVSLVSSLEHRLSALKRKLHSRDSIKNIAQQYLDREISNGVAKLHIAESNWNGKGG